jgi:putative DNA methylase
MTNDRRLIEDFIPIREISVEAAREKSIRKGHISTLHLWWARRPLVAARAAVFASLVAAPPSSQKRTALSKVMIDLCKWEAGKDTINKAKNQILEAQRERLNLPSNTPLNQVPPPKVLDMFSGGGAIPLEALRLGCETYAIELNPVAHIIELCTLVYPQKYGKELASEVEKWGNWVIEKVREEIGDLYPSITPQSLHTLQESEGHGTKQSQTEDAMTDEQLSLNLGSQFADNKSKIQNPKSKNLTPVAYLWTRTVKCPNPACVAGVPLVRQTWLCKKSKKYVALKVIPNHETKQVEFEVVEAATEKELGFDPAAGSSRGNSTCRHCGTTVDVDYVKKEGFAERINQQLMAIICTSSGREGKAYLAGTAYIHYIPDEVDLKNRIDKLCVETSLTIPNEPLPNYGVLGFRVQPYGLVKWSDLFTSRQLLSLMTFVKWVRLAHQEMLQQGYEEELAKAISTYLGLLVNRIADRASTLCRYDPTPTQSGINNTFSRQALPMVWDFGEGCPIGESSGSASNSLPWITNFIKQEANSGLPCILQRSSSTSMPIDSESLDAVVTDPPYFDSVPYADLSDFFYVWLKRSIGHLYPEHFSSQLTPKKNEAIMEPSRHGGDKKKAAQFYQEMMHKAFCEASRVLKPNGMMVVVYAHKTTSGWSTLIDSLRRAGFTITEAWPLDTEMGSRLRGQNSAALASSIFLVSRKRIEAKIGDYAMDVRPELAEIVRDRVKTLMAEGVTGADLVIACIGAGLRAYTQYDRVELPNGDELDANSFLDEVQKEVLEAVLTDVLLCDKKGVSAVDKPTQYYILGRYEYGEAIVEFDEANTLARGVGVELDSAGGLTDGIALVKKTKNQVQLRDYSERGASEDLGIQKTEKQQTFNVKPQVIGMAPTLIDILHRLLWLAENKPQEIPNFLTLAQPDATQLRLVAQALAGRALTPEAGATDVTSSNRTKEQQQIDTLLASWKRVVEDNLFTQSK